MADDGDYYRETLDAAGVRYLRDNEMAPRGNRRGDVRVRGRPAPVRRTLVTSAREVLCPLLPAAGRSRGLPTAGWVSSVARAGRSVGMNRAGNLQEFASALEAFAVPAQNLVAADTTAHSLLLHREFPRRALVREATPVPRWQRPGSRLGGYLSWAEHPNSPEPGRRYNRDGEQPGRAGSAPRLEWRFWEPPYGPPASPRCSATARRRASRT